MKFDPVPLLICALLVLLVLLFEPPIWMLVGTGILLMVVGLLAGVRKDDE
jgi:hypothetical protein